jgi:hypothetical protein
MVAGDEVHLLLSKVHPYQSHFSELQSDIREREREREKG